MDECICGRLTYDMTHMEMCLRTHYTPTTLFRNDANFLRIEDNLKLRIDKNTLWQISVGSCVI